MLKKHEIIFEEEWSADNISTYERIRWEIDYIKQNKIALVDINLNNIKDLNYKNIAILLSLVYEVSKILSRQVYISATQCILTRLTHIGFWKLNYLQNGNIDDSESVVANTSVLLPISKFKGSNNDREVLLSKLRDNNRENLSYVRFIINNLSENCTEHISAESSTVDCFAYVENRNRRIQLFVMDLGEGFYESFERNNTMKDFKNNVQAIKEVVVNQCSSKNGEKNGYGIVGIVEILKEKNGQMYVRSNEAFVEYDQNSIKEGTEIPELKGSCILIEYDDE